MLRMDCKDARRAQLDPPAAFRCSLRASAWGRVCRPQPRAWPPLSSAAAPFASVLI
jgi:hypothetical protein